MKSRALYIRLLFTKVCLLLLLSSAWNNSSGYSVSGLTATCRNGQVFLVWEIPVATGLQYNVYRSTSPFTSSSDVISSNFLGFVRDNSSKNIQISEHNSSDVFFKIENDGLPMLASQGLYVVTCTSDQSYYYAVTVTTLSDDIESKALITDENTLASAINELVASPEPVYQYSEPWSIGESVDRYVQFVNNQETPLYPAMTSTGSYGFNFYILKRGSAIKYPLIVIYEGIWENSIKGNGLGEFENKNITNCYIMGVDDWIPTPKTNGEYGEHTAWCGYHENFNIYSSTNPIPQSGIVKPYSQRRYIQSIRWAKTHLAIDTSEIYTVGVSAGGFGAMLTANLYPDEIAAVYAVVEPSAFGSPSTSNSKMWGTRSSNLLSDVLNWKTMDALPIYTILNSNLMIKINETRNFPLLFDIHGKNDATILWNTHSITWLDSLQTNHTGGIFYWDQRGHDGDNTNFLDSEITPEFYRYRTNLSFPAFSNCDINQDPGDGSPTSGDLYGAINGYLDWEDNIVDNLCDYTIHLLVKDFYAGGVLSPDQFSTVVTDITFRRLQNFHPQIGSIVYWENFNAANDKIQNGFLVYNSSPISLSGIIINKDGTRLELTGTDCGAPLNSDGPGITAAMSNEVYFTKSASGYIAHISSEKNQKVNMSIYDLMGKTLAGKSIQLTPGDNSFEVISPGSGIFLVMIANNDFQNSSKLFF